MLLGPAAVASLLSLFLPAAPLSSQSASDLLNRAMDAVVNQETSVSFTDTTLLRYHAVSQRDVTTTYIGRDGASQGQLEVTRYGSFRTDFTMTGKGLFVNGNVAGLTSGAGFTRQAAMSEAGKWLFTAAVKKDFPEQYNGLQLQQVPVSWFLGGAQLSVLAPAVVRGQTVQRVKEVAHTPSGTVTEIVFIGAHDLPVRMTSNTSGAYPESEVVDYSLWGKERPISVPVHFVPIRSGWLDPSWPGRRQI